MGKTVLTIDDSKTIRLLVARHLTPFGVKTLEAENGEQGAARAREETPDLILLDYNMPVMDGYDTLVTLKADQVLKSIPVVMLTTETVKETVVRLMKLGLKGYIAKPFTRDILLQKINPILGLYEGDGVPPEVSANHETSIRGAAQIPGKPAILAIDDKENILKMLKEFIGESFQVITANSGKAALSAIAQNGFEFVFLDMSLPDMNALDIYEAYIRSGRNGSNPAKFVAMPLRTAQADIDRARAQGIKLFLHKPFTREDVAQAIVGCMAPPEDKNPSNAGRLTAIGDIRILVCPDGKSSLFQAFAGDLGTGLIKEIDEMAEEGLTKLIIKVSEGFLSNLNVTRKFINLVEHTSQLSLSVRFVADSQQAREALKQFAETATIPVELSLECAIRSMS
jgi:two-component system, chemotaxis family, chemotaxis protein CheY